MRYQTDIINERFRLLPELAQDVLSSNETSVAIQEIAKEHGVHVDQAGSISQEMMYVILGLEPAANMATNIATHAGIDKQTAWDITQKIDSQILSAIRNSLTEAHQQMKQAEEQKKQKTAQAANALDPAQLGAVDSPLPETVLTHRTNPGPDPGSVAALRMQQEGVAMEQSKRVVEEKPLHERVNLPETDTSSKYKEVDPYREQVT